MDPDLPGTVTLFNSEVSILTAIVLALLLLLGIAAILVWALLRAGAMKPPAALVTALSMLTLIAMIGGIATTNDEAWAIAAAGVGALAGSVTNVYQSSMEYLMRQQEKLQDTVIQALPDAMNGESEKPEEPEPSKAVWDEER